jgi:hypothetical protein
MSTRFVLPIVLLALSAASSADAQKKSAADTITPSFTVGSTYMSAGATRLDFALSVRAGIVRGFGSQAWTSDANRVDNGPTGLCASYLRLVFSRPMKTRRDAIIPTAGAFAQTVLR